VTVGQVAAPEDAVFVDLDQDGAMDVVSCCEGDTKTVFVHWAPREREQYLDPAAWRTEPIPALKDMAQWMFCLPLQVDGRQGMDLVLGAKGDGAKVGWLEAPKEPRNLAGWRWHPICAAGWIMSLVAQDLDDDGDPDLIVSDRKGDNRGCFWLEHPGLGDNAGNAWKMTRITPTREEVMFLDLVDLDRDGWEDIVVPTFDRKLFFYRRKAIQPPAWESIELPFPPRDGSGKAAYAGDFNADGRLDLVLTLGEGQPNRGGVVWMSPRGKPSEKPWTFHSISEPPDANGFKPDRIELLDLDGDGDLDVITTEERRGLGVVWWENPGNG
jgi:hypothetical protein